MLHVCGGLMLHVCVVVSCALFVFLCLLFLSPQVKDYARMMSAVQGAVAQRREAQVAFWDAQEDLAKKESYHNKIAGQAGKEHKAAKAREDWTAAQDASETARRHFERVSETFFREVGNFKGQKVQDFRAMLLDFIQLQIDHSKKVEEDWTRVLPVLEEIVREPEASTVAPCV